MKLSAYRLVLRKIRVILGIFICLLVLSGLTAFPLLKELNLLVSVLNLGSHDSAWIPAGLRFWLLHVHEGLTTTYIQYPFIAYGTDWLAFAHLAIAIFFIGPWIDPVRNIGVIYSGIAACICVIPTALICGAIRGIPFYWRMIDCSFGVLGLIPLWYVVRLTQKLASIPIDKDSPWN